MGFELRLRERIVLENGRYQVLNTDYSFSGDELIREIQDHPERFSPKCGDAPGFSGYRAA